MKIAAATAPRPPAARTMPSVSAEACRSFLTTNGSNTSVGPRNTRYATAAETSVPPIQRTRKSRCFSGTKRCRLEKPPGRSSCSKLCCIGRRPSANVDLLRLAEEAEQCLRPHWAGEQETLTELTAEVLQRPLLFRQLDALGDDLQRQACAQGDDRGLQRDVLARADERPVHLQDVDREPTEVAERRVARSEVVHREADAEPLQIEQPLNGEVRVRHHHRLCDLEDERRGGKTGPLKRCADVVHDRLRL